MTSSVSSNLGETPAMITMSAAVPSSGTVEVAIADPAGVLMPLPSLRTSARRNVQEDVAPLPTIRPARASSPEAQDLEHDDDIARRDTYDEQDTVDGAVVDDSELIQNPVASWTGMVNAVNAPLLTASTDRSMAGQTIRSFEARPGTVARAKAPAAASTAALVRAGSSSTVVTFDDVAPSELEIYNQAGLIPTAKGEKVAAHRIRTDENELRMCTHIVTMQRRIEHMENKSSAQYGEILRRFEDMLANGTQGATSITSPAISADVDRLNAMMMEGRAAITNLTAAVNDLIDLPRDIARLTRTVQNLAREDRDSPTVHPVAYSKSGGNGAAAGFKRSSTFAGFNDPTESKRSRSYSDEPSYTDVYLWNVDIEAAAPMNIAHRAMAELKMGDLSNNIISVARPRATPKTVISIRFRGLPVAEEFIDRLHSNPPAVMAKLHAAKKEVYERKGKASDKGNLPCLRIVAWNVHGRLAVKISQSDIVRLINGNDVIVFQETFLRIGEERTLDLPRGFEVIAMSRPDLPGLRSAGGGVAAVIRMGTPYSLLSHLCAPDLIALDLGHLFLIGAYIPPEGSNWSEWTDVEPKIKVAEAVTVLSAIPDKPLMFKGDTNSRTGERSPAGALLTRSSADPVVNSRGRWLLRLCSDTSMTILNGTVKEASGRGAFTSFQPMGASVIDYCFVSPGLVPRIADGALRIVKVPEWSDHAQIQVTVVKPEERLVHLPTEPVPRSSPIVFGEPTPLDVLLEATVAAAVSSKGATSRLYGPVYERSNPLTAYIGTSTVKGRAAFAVWRGMNNSANRGYMVDGIASEGKACILAILCAVRDCPGNKSLIVYTTSQYAIRSLCFWAGDNETRGWSCANGDALRDTVDWISRRCAPVEFRWVAAAQDNPVMNGCKRHAREALQALAPVFGYSLPPTDSGLAMGYRPPLKDVMKVSTQLAEVPEPRSTAAVTEITAQDIIDPDVAHRGRQREREIMRDNLLKLMACNGKSSKPFWKLIRGWTDIKPMKPRVTLEQLHDSFKARLNPPDELPAQFDANLHDIVQSLNATIPKVTTDRTPGKFFTRRITIKDIQEVKRKLQNKSFRSAVGIDDVSYARIRAIPNDALVNLFHACLDDLDAPQKWLVTLLIGILKEGRVVDDPESYRLVGLECCLLKVLTLLLDGRLREWTDSRNIIPDSQNGFQPGHRTDDNSFILLCAIHRARAEGKTLYVFFGDLTNAFPYTDTARLWSDMYAAGAGGPFFDLIRMVYARMSYAVRYGEEHSLPFRSLIGLFTGDSASPTLWNIYFADFRLPPHKDDVHLNGRPVSQAEQADDCLIMSTTFPAFQSKVNNFDKWGTNKRAFVSGNKSKWMIFGPLPDIIPTLWCGNAMVELVFEFKYVGIWFTSIHKNVMARHYAIKASKARATSNASFALKHRIGSLPVREGLMLYMARVDCYLISGAELALDTEATLLGELQDVQHMYLRRLLGLNSHSMLAVLFTETGLMPVRFRRLLLALSRLRYMLGVDPGRVVHSALLDSVALCRAGQPGWASDLLIMLRRLPTAVILQPEDLLCDTVIDAVSKEIVAIVDADLQHDIDRLVKTHLLRNRVEMRDDRSTGVVPRRLRHYLTAVAIPAHRKAMTGVLLGDHNLSVERLRYGSRYRRPVPREFRLCRFCRGSVEDEVHALFDCVSEPRLIELRAEFLGSLTTLEPELRALYGLIPTYEFMLKVIPSRRAVQIFAKFIYLILSVFQETPRFCPLVFTAG